MSLIRNLIKEPEEHKPRKKKNDQLEDEEEEKTPRPIVKSATDLQRLRLEKLMKNPDKPIVIPEAPREKDYMQTVPSFVRNVMGSSAGAGSGEFHVYRHLRRKEYARQKTIQAKSIREQLDDEYQQKLDDNHRKAEEKTAKKRAKRLKRKNRVKKPREQNNVTEEAAEDVDESNGESEQDDANNATEKQESEHTLNAKVTKHDVSHNAETVQNSAIEEQQEENASEVEKPETPSNHENNTKSLQSLKENAQTPVEAEKTAGNTASAIQTSAENEIQERSQDVNLESTE